MSSGSESEQAFPSTTYEWRKVKIRQPPQGTDTARRRRSTWKVRSPWDRRQPLSLRVTYCGGNESWWYVEARGLSGRLPGYLSLDDVMSVIMNDGYATDPNLRRRK